MKNLEIEFKNPINEETYNLLIKKFNLENNIFHQTNYYFDSLNNDLGNKKVVLRIRFKEPNRYKITLKSQSHQGALEEHVLITEEKAKALIENGFNVKDYFDEDLIVTFKGKLDNLRVSTPYKDGELFVDKIMYFGIEDYEVEYEVDSYDEGLVNFNNFLNEYKIKKLPSLRKSERVFEYLKKK